MTEVMMRGLGQVLAVVASPHQRRHVFQKRVLENRVKKESKMLSIQQKIKLLMKLEHGVGVMKLRHEYGARQTTIFDLKALKDRFDKFYDESNPIKGMAECKTFRVSQNSDLSKFLYSKKFRQRCSEGMPVSVLMEKAKAFRTKLKIETSSDYSTGWSRNTKKRHGDSCLKVAGTKLSADREANEKYEDDFARLVSDNIQTSITQTKHDNSGDVSQGMAWFVAKRYHRSTH